MTSSPMRFVRSRLVSVCVLGLVLAGCQSTPPAPTTSPAPATGTEILWDRYGVPHIFAPDHPSLFQAYGYAQMEAHAELLVRLYAQARGRGAEFYGAQYLDADRSVRTNGLPATAKQWAAGQSAEFAPPIEAFAKGLNAWAQEHKAELSAEAQGVLPLTVEDVRAILADGPRETLLRVGSGHAHAAAPALPYRLRGSRWPHRLRLQRDAAGAPHRRLPTASGRASCRATGLT